MEKEKKLSKEYEISITNGDTKGSLKLKNINNRVVASIGDIILDSLSYFRWVMTTRFMDKYNKKKESRKIMGKETPMPPKFLIEILNNAIQEDDDELQNEWNNLLINWQDPNKICDKKYMYIELLKNLDKNEIKILKAINNDISINGKTILNGYYEKNKTMEFLTLSSEEYELALLNLYRLKICDSLKSRGNDIMLGDLPVLADAGIEKFKLTIIGYNLIKMIEE